MLTFNIIKIWQTYIFIQILFDNCSIIIKPH